MAFQKISNARICGIAASVPRNTESNLTLPCFPEIEEAKKFIKSTGIIERRVTDEHTTSSDLCYHAAEGLIEELGWEREGIDCLIFVSQTPDFIVPATSCILQDRLGLSAECSTFDITLGCSAWVQGLSVAGSLLSSSGFKKVLLLVGETASKTKSSLDKSIYPLFGDAGTATAMEFDEGHDSMYFHSGTDGSSYMAVNIPDGGFRNPATIDSLKMEAIEPGVKRNRLQYVMDGGAVFVFSISKPPKSITSLVKKYDIQVDDIDYYFLHQANKIMVEKIAKKLNAPMEKVPCSFDHFGNTSMCSIPLTMVVKKREELTKTKLRNLACGFGGGLAWTSAYFTTENLVVPELIEV